MVGTELEQTEKKGKGRLVSEVKAVVQRRGRERKKCWKLLPYSSGDEGLDGGSSGEHREGPI